MKATLPFKLKNMLSEYLILQQCFIISIDDPCVIIYYIVDCKWSFSDTVINSMFISYILLERRAFLLFLTITVGSCIPF